MEILIHHLYHGALTDSAKCTTFDTEKLLWETPGPFSPLFRCMVDTWVRPLWGLVGDEYFLESRCDFLSDPIPALHGRLTYENVMAVIEKDVGPGELSFRAALRVPLPPPTAHELSLKPAFQCLIHIGTVPEFKHAVTDIAKGALSSSSVPYLR